MYIYIVIGDDSMKKRLSLLGMALLLSLSFAGCNSRSTTSNVDVPAITSPEITVPAGMEEMATQNQESSEQTEPQVTENALTTEGVKEETTPLITSTAALPNPALDAKKIVEEAFTTSDPYFDFKVKYTQDFLDRTNTMLGLLDERYVSPYRKDPEGFHVSESGERSQLLYRRTIDDIDESYKYIKRLEYFMGFEDASDDLYAFHGVYLTLCDEDKDGKIELNNVSSTILKTFYPDFDLALVQEKINEAIEAEKRQDYESISIDLQKKNYGRVYFNWYRYEDNPVEVQINLTAAKDYPQ